MNPRFFGSPAKFRAWLKKHHATEKELWVGFHKVHSGVDSITWPESVDEALCFGWIDGIRKSIDANRYMIRFTPRKRASIWSAVNTKRARELIDEGRMQPAGLAAFELRDEERTRRYSFEQDAVAFTAEQERAFRRNKAAWQYFQAQRPSYRRQATWWVTSAKREETRARRLATLIADSASGRWIAGAIVGRTARTSSRKET